MSPPKERPAPLVAPDVDISSLAYMPLFIARLRGSKLWLITRRRPELFRPMFAMWMRAYQERPAGSLEADDDVLADAAELTFEAWIELKTDLMRGWTLCSDNRYYHQVLAEIVRQSYENVVIPNKLRTAAATEARLKKLRDRNVTTTSRSRDDGKVATSRAPGREVGREVGRKEAPPNGGASAPGINGAPRHAYLDTLTARRIRDFGKVRDPISAQIIDEWGGVGAVQALSDDEWFARQTEFETRYAELSAKAPH